MRVFKSLKFVVVGIMMAGMWGLSAAPAPVLAAPATVNNICNQGTDTSQATACNDQKNGNDPLMGPNGILTRVVQILVYVVGIVSVIMVIVGGLRYILSNGDTNAVNSAKNGIIYALVGVVVAILAQSIVTFVLSKLG